MMFKSIKENLTTIANNQDNISYASIAKYLLECMENNVVIKSKDCALACFVSESVLTAFAKKYGYEGFREIVIRIKVENEYYPHQNNLKNLNKDVLENNFRDFFEKNLNLVDDQGIVIKKLINNIKTAENSYLISCYEQEDSVSLFAGELQFLGFNVFFNSQRKNNSAWLTKAKKEDLFVFFAFGIDNQYIVNYFQIALQKCNKVVVITSSSQKHKFLQASDLIIIDYPDRENISISTRTSVLTFLFANILYELK
ncbi:MurR/RpiR family transcriptional regulator [Spiroplasma alleghenense]|uniref:HTH rpiR-type domain-containing protein n=1 Tax=Spiroplasma alleghenense TaxID=216931 RepID=A0A345Z2Z4_9MOLU|nr:MurR/RpiR family transcriptional regulator [Spiroplasma alleghenense]AXK50973.1 hypothetical protein SALLE_v1c02990 [Spiroplasma alleghenense]